MSDIIDRTVPRNTRLQELREQHPEQEVFLVPAGNVEQIGDYARRMNRKAEKLGLEVKPITVSVLGEPELLRFQREIRDSGAPGGWRLVWSAIEFVPLIVQGETPVLPGWTFIGTIDRLPDEETGTEGSDTTVFRMVAGEEIPKHAKDRPQFCDHCQTTRRRNLTYLVRHDETGEVKQVGSTCIKDYLGHRSAEAVAQFMQWWLILYGLSNWDVSEYDEDEYQRIRHLYATPEEYLPWVALEVRLNGWVSRKSAHENLTTSSSSAAMDRMLVMTRSAGTLGVKRNERPNDQDYKMAHDAIEFILGLPAEKRDADDYWYNLHKLIDHGLFHIRKHRGIVGSAIRVWQIEVERREREARAASATNAPYGDIGARYDLTLEVLLTKDLYDNLSNEWKSTLCKFRGTGDADGHLFVWFASSPPQFAKGDTILCRATIRNHQTFQGTYETVLTRVKVTKGAASAALAPSQEVAA
jgi:hypothetical protein